MTSLHDRLTRASLSSRPAARRLRVFAVEDTSLQLTWGVLGPGPVRIRAADSTAEIDADGGPGGVVVDGLPPDQSIQVVLSGDGVPDGQMTVATHTLPRPPGEELCRLATISDLHLGAVSFGYRRTIIEDDRPIVPHPARCTAAAIQALEAWGAERLVVKGDITDRSDAWDWRTFGRLVAGLDMPVDVLPGNHDQVTRRTIDPVDGARGAGLTLVEGVRVVDLPGLRLLLVDATVPGTHHGSVRPITGEVVAALRDAPAGALVALHHHLQPHAATEGWPWGVSNRESLPFLDAVGSAHADTLVTSGHTHRHRRWHRGPVTVTQVGSTKDYPGVWAGYVVHEGGIRQVVRRVTVPDCIAWTERTRTAALGLWGVTAPGRLSWRCFSLRWDGDRRPTR